MEPKHQHIRDKQKLFQKLFVSPSYCQTLDPPLLVAPDFINILLEDSARAPRRQQLQLVDQIIIMFIQRPTNSLMLYAHDQTRPDISRCIFDAIVMRVLGLVQSEDQVDLYLEKLGLVMAYYRIGVSNVAKLTQWVSRALQQQKFHPCKFMFVLRLLKCYYSRKLGCSKSPRHYFYMFGSDNVGIQLVAQNTGDLTLKNQMCVTLSFNSLGEISRPYNIFLIKTDRKEEIGLTYDNGSLKLTALYDGQYLDEYTVIKNFLSDQVWYRIVVNLTTSETVVIINNQFYKGKALLKKERERRIVGAAFGRQFFGMLGSILIASRIISLQKLDTKQFPYGVDSIEHLKLLTKNKLNEGIIFSALPFSTFQLRQNVHCFDPFRRNHSTISDNVVVVRQPICERSLQHMGGFSLVLPLFYIARFYDRQQYPSMLEDLLKIVREIFDNNEVERLEVQILGNNCLQILGQHLSQISYLQTARSVSILFSIYEKLRTPKAKSIYIRDVIWMLRIGMNGPREQLRGVGAPAAGSGTRQSSTTLFSSANSNISSKEKDEALHIYYKSILNLYNKQPKLTFESINFAEVVYWAAHNLQTSQVPSFCCCLQHHLNQAINNADISVEQLLSLDSARYTIHYTYVEQIIYSYLNENSRKQEYGPGIQESLNMLLRLFLKKYSSCFYLMILRVIRRFICEHKVTDLFKVFTNQNSQLTAFLVFLSEKTVNPDIILEIFYIFLALKSRGPASKTQIFVKSMLQILQTNNQVSIKQQNPIRRLIKKVRKKSLQEKSDSQYMQETAKRQRSQSFSYFTKKPAWAQTTLTHQLSQLIERCPKPIKLGNHPGFYNLVMNQLSDVVSLEEPSVEGTVFSESSIMILKEYYKLAQPCYKQHILLFLLVSLEKNLVLRSSKPLTLFLLECLRQSLYIRPEETRNLLTIFTCLFSQVISHHKSIIEYYTEIKYLKITRSCISAILPNVLSKIIKLADLSQLCQLMMICVYELIEGHTQAALQMTHIVLSEVDAKLKKFIFVGENNVLKSVKALQKCQLYQEVLYQSNNQQLNILIQNPFNEAKQTNSAENEEVDADGNNLVGEKEDISDLRQQSKQTNVPVRRQSPSNGSREEKQKEDSFRFVTKITALEVYVKLFFRFVQATTQEQNYQHLVDKKSKESKYEQLAYVYEFRQKSDLINDFVEIVNFYFKNIIHSSQPVEKGYVRFILTYILYKIKRAKESTKQDIIMPCQVLEPIFRNCIQKYLTPSTSSIKEVLRAMAKQQVKTTLLSYFIRAPLMHRIEDFKAWAQNKQAQLIQYNEKSIYQIFVKQTKYSSFFKSIDDNHDLLIVRFYQHSMEEQIGEYENLISNYASQKHIRNIQKLFDTENSLQEKNRIAYLYENQCRFRKSHNEWDQLWTKLRIYHQPYGFWMAQKFKQSCYTYPQRSQRNFKFCISEFCSQGGINPILEAKIIQPWVIVKDNKTKKSLHMNLFSQIIKPNIARAQKKSGENTNNLIGSMWKNMLSLTRRNDMLADTSSEYEVVMINRSVKATGRLFIQNKQSLIFSYEGARQDDSHLAFQKFSLPFNRETFHKWPLFHIENIRVHRYLLKYDALEITFIYGNSIIFHFFKEDKQQFLKQIERIQRESAIQKVCKLNKISFGYDTLIQTKGIDPKITQRWIKREISNLEYLMIVNRAASRGIKDLSQYAVFPWVVELQKQKQPRVRDLSKTMGGLGSEQRKRIINQKYFAKDPFNPHPPFFFGTHYSSPAVVFNFLIRLSPFTEYCKHLQGGKFDIPDRLFSSLTSAWRSATEEVSDVRELIPQMYYLPQALINIDENFFGYTQNQELVDHIEMPPWGASNPYYFTSQLRQILEDEQVSQKISQWIDLIFGCKQRGKQAEQSYNVYYYLTYEDQQSIDEDEDEVYKISKQAQITHFGQIPPQLFDRPHPSRNPLPAGSMHQLKTVKTIKLINKMSDKLIGIKVVNNQLILCKRKELEIYSTLSEPAALQRKKVFNFDRSISDCYYVIKRDQSRVHFLNRPYFVVWGYINNQFRVFSRSTGDIAAMDQLPCAITALHVSNAEDLILVGLESGVLLVYEIQHKASSIAIQKVGSESFLSAVSSINEYDGFYSITFSNYCAVYKIHRSLHYLSSSPTRPFIRFLRSFWNPLPLKQSLLMRSPLYSVVLVDNANIRCYSINGQLIESVSCSAKYYGRFHDHNLHDVLYTVDEEKVMCYSLPYLRNISMMELRGYEQVLGCYLLGKMQVAEVGFAPE